MVVLGQLLILCIWPLGLNYNSNVFFGGFVSKNIIFYIGWVL